MNRNLSYSLLLIVAVATSAQAQVTSGRGGPPTRDPNALERMRAAMREQVFDALETKYVEMNQQVQQPVAKRTYKVESLPSKKTKLFKADPKLLENKFVATIDFHVPKEEQPSYQVGSSGRFGSGEIRESDWQLAIGETRFEMFGSYPEDLKRLIRWGRYLVYHLNRGSPATDIVALSQHHKLMAEQCSPQDRPNERMIQFLTSADCDRDVLRSHPNALWQYLIYAPSAKEAEQRAAALLQLIDGGMCRPMQRFMLAEGQKALADARAKYQEVAKQHAALKAEEAKIAKPSEISADILSQLKAQKVMVAVELAGLNARVKACDEMLKNPVRLEVSALQSISDMKVKAEIERVGIKEKLDQINTFISEGDGRQVTQARISTMLNELLNRTHRSAVSAESQASTWARLFDLYAPLPLADDQITISPVEWTN